LVTREEEEEEKKKKKEEATACNEPTTFTELSPS
jgi:hypothetical protein